MQKEIWKPVPVTGYKNLFSVSNLGKVKSLDRTILYRRLESRNKFRRELNGRILKPYFRGSRASYYSVTIGVKESGASRKMDIHRLVAKAFIPNPKNKPQVNHKNGNKTDNRVVNLEWVTEKENMEHARKNGFIKSKKK